jgi:hypothetical protein
MDWAGTSRRSLSPTQHGLPTLLAATSQPPHPTGLLKRPSPALPLAVGEVVGEAGGPLFPVEAEVVLQAEEGPAGVLMCPPSVGRGLLALGRPTPGSVQKQWQRWAWLLDQHLTQELRQQSMQQLQWRRRPHRAYSLLATVLAEAREEGKGRAGGEAGVGELEVMVGLVVGVAAHQEEVSGQSRGTRAVSQECLGNHHHHQRQLRRQGSSHSRLRTRHPSSAFSNSSLRGHRHMPSPGSSRRLLGSLSTLSLGTLVAISPGVARAGGNTQVVAGAGAGGTREQVVAVSTSRLVGIRWQDLQQTSQQPSSSRMPLSQVQVQGPSNTTGAAEVSCQGDMHQLRWRLPHHPLCRLPT